MATEGDWEGKVRYVKFVKMSEGAVGEKGRRRGAQVLTWKNVVHVDIDCCAIQNCATCQHGIVSRTMDGLRTYAAPVEHQVPGASVAQAPEDGERATACYGGVRVGEPRWHAREHGVVRRGRPETCIRLRLGRLPECARVGDPVREEEAWWRQYRSRLGRTRARAGRTEEERGRADDDAHTQAGHGGGVGDVAEGEVWTAGDAASAEAKSVPS